MSPSKSILALLTEDLLVRINSRLSDNTDRKSWRRVCTEFHRVDSLTRRTLRVLRIEFLPSLLIKFNNIDSLDLSVCPRVNDGTVSMLLIPESSSWTRQIKVLILSRATGLTYSGLEQVVRACAGLEVIDVSQCLGFGDREASSISNAKRLRELTLDKCSGVTDVGLAKIVVGCGKLERLSLKWCLEISDLGVGFLCKKCVDLKFLDVSYLQVTNESLHSIASLPRLEILNVVGCRSVDDVGLQFLENACPLLKAIDFSRCDGISSSGLISIIRGHNSLEKIDLGFCFSDLSVPFLNELKDLKNLKRIKLDGARISEPCFNAIGSQCKSLVEIGLCKCVGVTNMGIIQMVSGCEELEILNLTCCHSITDSAISAIADSCRELVSLKLESCNMITEKGLDRIGSYCFSLEELDLTDCCGITDKGLEYLSRCSQLLCLKLGLCTNISDKGLIDIAQNCTKIRELDLYRSTGIGDDGLGALSKSCKKLMKLNLSYCNKITDRGMEYISRLEDLSYLEIRGLENISSVGLTQLAAGCKRLAELDIKLCKNIDDSGFWALAYYSRNLRQIRMGYCAVSDGGLCMVMGNLICLQNASLVHLPNVSAEGFELALRSCSAWIKKVKLLSFLRFSLSTDLLETLQARGCKIRWDYRLRS